MTTEIEEFEYDGEIYKWTAVRDSEHPDFCLFCEKGEIWVQVERTPELDRIWDLFSEGKVKFPINLGIVQQLISMIVEGGYTDSYFQTDVGLIFTESGQLLEN